MFDTLFRLADHELDARLASLFERDRIGTTELLAHIAESDARRRYAPAGYPSMHAYCMGRFGLTDDVALKHLRVARTARKFPAIWAMLHDGRLSPSLVLMLVAQLAPETADELLAAAAHKTRAEVEQLLVARRPKPDVPAVVEPISRNCQQFEVAPGPPVPPLELTAPASSEPAAARSRVEAPSPQHYALQFTIDQEAHELLRHAQELAGHAVAPGDIPELFKRAIRELVRALERRRFAACARTRPRKARPDGRYVPAEIRRAVCRRDGGQCTFVGEHGHRCESRERLQFDHVTPLARGGRTTADNLRLRCRAHNQYEAERAFGAGFMERKRQEARRANNRAREAVRAREAKRAREAAGAREREAEAVARAHEVIPWLRQLGFRADEARRGAAACEAISEAPLEQRVRHALKSLAPPNARRAVHTGSGPA